jgi:hypothetical protein
LPSFLGPEAGACDKIKKEENKDKKDKEEVSKEDN